MLRPDDPKPAPDTGTIGKRIAYYRKLGDSLSAEELAKRAGNGLTRSVITNLENGRKDDVTVKQLLALASALDIPPMALMFDLHRPDEHEVIRQFEDGGGHIMQPWAAINWVTGQTFVDARTIGRGGRHARSILNNLYDYKRVSLQLSDVSEAILDARSGDDPERLAQLEADERYLRNRLRNLRTNLRVFAVEFDPAGISARTIGYTPDIDG